jgi:UDP-glucose:glycoprotein glucosyltransferase
MAAGGIPPGQSVVWMNGLQLSSLVSLENLNFFKLVEIMRSERHWISSLTPLGISSLQARKLIVDEKLNLAMNPEASSASEIGEIDASSLGARFDASDRQEGGGAIIWFNDLEHDERYSMWPTTLRAVSIPQQSDMYPVIPDGYLLFFLLDSSAYIPRSTACHRSQSPQCGLGS